MNWITDNIAIGNYLDAQDLELHKAEAIRSLVCLDGKLRGTEPQVLHLDALQAFDLKDGPGNNPDLFKRAVETIGRFARLHPKLLVQCHAGRSRSVIAVAAHLIHTQEFTTNQALTLIKSKREIALTPGIEKLLQAPWLYSNHRGA